MTIHTVKSRISIPEVVELEAVAKAMQVAYTHGWAQVIFETALLMFNFLHWAAESLFNDVLLSFSNFQEISFSWVPRLANHLAHNVCKWPTTQYLIGFVEPWWLPHACTEILTQESVPEEAS